MLSEVAAPTALITAIPINTEGNTAVFHLPGTLGLMIAPMMTMRTLPRITSEIVKEISIILVSPHTQKIGASGVFFATVDIDCFEKLLPPINPPKKTAIVEESLPEWSKLWKYRDIRARDVEDPTSL